jgi:hypothetical protein
VSTVVTFVADCNNEILVIVAPSSLLLRVPDQALPNEVDNDANEGEIEEICCHR